MYAETLQAVKEIPGLTRREMAAMLGEKT